ncbi:uncharacterized protein [Diadema setosum]|uniref:uncharacterized protein n=1 Tax=Diadema setosum TaxID=31175 RepID=UPI003B3B829C
MIKIPITVFQMVRKYKATGKRKSWTSQDLRAALRQIELGESVRRVAERSGIPKSTLHDAKSGKNKHARRQQDECHLGKYSVFTAEQEAELANYAMEVCRSFFGLYPEQIRHMAYEYAERNKIKHPFNPVTKLAGKDWFAGFLRRNAQLALRTPEATSFARAIGFNKTAVGRFFDNVNSVLSENNISPSRIYNVDETGLSTSPNIAKSDKVVAGKGQKQVGKLTSAEKGQTITAVGCISACGTYVPPMLIFPRKNYTEALMNGCPPGSTGKASESGWINSELFVDWLKHFISFVGATPENKVLLILDNHTSHATLGAWKTCRDNGVVMVSIPPHTSHKLQPLDRTVYGPLKNAFARQSSNFVKTFKRRITPYDVANILNKAYSKIATVDKAVSGFRCTGIWPINPDVFDDEEYAPADTLMPPEPLPVNTAPQVTAPSGTNDVTPVTAPSGTNDVTPVTTPSGTDKAAPVTTPSGTDEAAAVTTPSGTDTTAPVTTPSGTDETAPVTTPSGTDDTAPIMTPSGTDEAPSRMNLHANEAANLNATPPDLHQNEEDTESDCSVGEGTAEVSMDTSDDSQSFYELFPLPKGQGKPSSRPRKRKAGQSEIITSTPVKIVLMAKQSRKDKVQQKKQNQAKSNKQKGKIRHQTNKQTVKKQKASVKKAGKKNMKPAKRWFCIFCKEEYLDPPTEDWIRCVRCNNWAHEHCTDYGSGAGSGGYLCDLCR